ncbi:hypothetical protein [Corynebacterium uterequi]|uniref:Uncharacterized protein n=1 Tax=Corynebacterium uterequi TaxID=1072256 RepID=A0A0G3HAY2_9CORY|nr:hypothetical protein [Corynebacterium uterequi]AKK10531.1 hypothetical protein CUTER_02580 [Corynebacterium uterequi]
MLMPMPGTTHLKIFYPDPPTPPAPAESAAGLPAADHRHARMLVALVLDASCGIRPLEHLRRADIAGPVRAQAAAHRRCGTARGPVRVATFHIDGTEIYGTAHCQRRVIAFTGAIEPRGLTAFRIL